MIQEIQAPNAFPEMSSSEFNIFLAGSIEMNTAEDWQKSFVKRMKDKFDNPESGGDVFILNPRRDNWDSSWKQTIEDKNFYEQVNWELDAMNASDLIVMYFDPDTKSPITLLELGLHADDTSLVVCCPDGFWRKGNVQIVCERYSIPLYNTMDDLWENEFG